MSTKRLFRRTGLPAYVQADQRQQSEVAGLLSIYSSRQPGLSLLLLFSGWLRVFTTMTARSYKTSRYSGSVEIFRKALSKKRLHAPHCLAQHSRRQTCRRRSKSPLSGSSLVTTSMGFRKRWWRTAKHGSSILMHTFVSAPISLAVKPTSGVYTNSSGPSLEIRLARTKSYWPASPASKAPRYRISLQLPQT